MRKALRGGFVDVVKTIPTPMLEQVRLMKRLIQQQHRISGRGLGPKTWMWCFDCRVWWLEDRLEPCDFEVTALRVRRNLLLAAIELEQRVAGHRVFLRFEIHKGQKEHES